MENYEQLKILKDAKKVCLIGHVEPDPDAISSMLTLKDFIKNYFNVNCVDMFAETEEFSINNKLLLEGEPINPTVTNYDIAIMMDSPNVERLGKYKSLFENATNKIVIDHHATNTYNGDINIVEICSSTCEIVFSICEYFAFNISKTNQGKLYAGIIADTNNFVVGEINKRTFNIASKICENINREEIYLTFLANSSLKNKQMLALAIQNSSTYENNQIIISFISQEQAFNHNTQHNDFIGIVNELATITNSKLVCFIEPRNNKYYVSMRAKKGYDVSTIAKSNGGGGHIGAAAFISEMNLDDLKNHILNQFLSQLNERNTPKTKLF